MNIDVPKAVTEARKIVAAWDAFVAQVHGSQPNARAQRSDAGTRRPRTLGRTNKDQILAVMNGSPMTIKQILNAIPGMNKSSLYVEMQNLAHEQKVTRVGHGVYQKAS